MEKTTAFNQTASDDFDNKIRKVIPFYDEIYHQIFELLGAYCGDRSLRILDTGCGSGNFSVQALENLHISELVLCDPSEYMLSVAGEKLKGKPCELICIGSENLNYQNQFDVVTAIQCHHYFDRETRRTAVRNCFNALKPGGILIYSENIAGCSETGRELMLRRVEDFGLRAGRTPEEVKHHSERYNTEFFPITVPEHLSLLRETGFETAELLWYSYMQGVFYGIKA